MPDNRSSDNRDSNVIIFGGFCVGTRNVEMA